MTHLPLASHVESGIPLFAWAFSLIFVAELVGVVAYVAWLAGAAL